MWGIIIKVWMKRLDRRVMGQEELKAEIKAEEI